MKTKLSIVDRVSEIVKELASLSIDEKVKAINEIRQAIHEQSPFSDEPVDFVRWVSVDDIGANDYNPNSVAPPEMKLLAHSIQKDGYTQPIVAWKKDESFEVVDGFHRHRVGREVKKVAARIHGYLPLAVINKSNEDRGDRIASTIRHNRARGKHKVEAMSDIVVELKRRNWSDDKICKNLGMDPDEVLRLCQITGLAELFSDQKFSQSWDVEGSITESDFEELSDDINTYGDESEKFRTVNTSDEKRIFHTYKKWECYKAGFYATKKEGMKKEECLEEYRKLLSDIGVFKKALKGVIGEWNNSCEHYLTNAAMNRIAWLGQASLCYAKGIPSTFRGGFNLLTEKEQNAANEAALEYLNIWLIDNKMEPVEMNLALGDRQSDIY